MHGPEQIGARHALCSRSVPDSARDDRQILYREPRMKAGAGEEDCARSPRWELAREWAVESDCKSGIVRSAAAPLGGDHTTKARASRYLASGRAGASRWGSVR